MDKLDELRHWGIKKGQAKKNHKYIKRVWKNGRWVYYYNDDNSAKPNNTIVRGGKTNGLLDSKTTISIGNTRIISKNEGRLSRYAKDVKRDYYRAKNTVKSNKQPGVTDTNKLFGNTTKINGTVISETRGSLERTIDTGREFLRLRGIIK